MEKFVARVDVASAEDDDVPGNVSDSVTPKAGASFLLHSNTYCSSCRVSWVVNSAFNVIHVYDFRKL